MCHCFGVGLESWGQGSKAAYFGFCFRFFLVLPGVVYQPDLLRLGNWSFCRAKSSEPSLVFACSGDLQSNSFSMSVTLEI